MLCYLLYRFLKLTQVQVLVYSKVFRYESRCFPKSNYEDRLAVEEIARQPTIKYKLKCWLDKCHLTPGVSWQEALEDVLDQGQTIAVFLRPSKISSWEIEDMCVARKLDTNMNILIT